MSLETYKKSNYVRQWKEIDIKFRIKQETGL